MNRILLFTFLFLSLLSCSNDTSEEQRIEATKIVEARSTKDLLDNLYLASGSDYETLSRILKASPSSLERLRKGETEATEAFSQNVKNAAIYYYTSYDASEYSFTMLRSEMDSEYGICDSILNFPSHYTFLFVLIIGILFCYWAFVDLLGGFWAIALFGGVFLCAWFFQSSPDPAIDEYNDYINPVVETYK